MKTKAAILVETKKPLELVELQIPSLQEGQILVKISYSGICGTQLMEIDGKKGDDKWLPHCLGHEAVAKVLDTHASVSKFKLDDEVVLSWIKGNGIDAGGCQYNWNGSVVNAGPVTTFQDYAVVSENRATKLNHIAHDAAYVLLGCAAPTGMGAVVNVLKGKKDNSIAVLGAGGIGLCSILMAKDIGMHPIISVDTSDERLALAKTAGADIIINPGNHNVDKLILSEIKNGLDFCVEATGSKTVIENLMQCLKPRSGKAVIVGNVSHGESVNISPAEFNAGKSLLGTWGGNSDPDKDMDLFFKVIEKHKQIVKKLCPANYCLDEVNTALEAMRQKTVGRALLNLSIQN
jgi:S-(hydroxymethyl)glutathione dehydrogenase / alcohol dehydrogenase